MKKKYICPQMIVAQLDVCKMIAQSGFTPDESLEGFDGYGGNTSDQDADARITVPNAWEEGR
jgi:hypothetical protein